MRLFLATEHLLSCPREVSFLKGFDSAGPWLEGGGGPWSRGWRGEVIVWRLTAALQGLRALWHLWQGGPQAGDVRSQGLVPEWTFGLVAATKIGMLEPHVSAFAPPYVSELSSLLGGGVCPYTVERHRQFLFGDKGFIRARMCVWIRLPLPPQTYWKNPRGFFSITLVLMMQINFACLPPIPSAGN